MVVTDPRPQLPELASHLARVRKWQCRSQFLQELDQGEHLGSMPRLESIDELADRTTVPALVELDGPEGRGIRLYTMNGNR